MVDELKKMIEQRLKKIAINAFENNPMKDSPLEGMMVMNAIGEASKSYKEQLILEKEKLSLNENEITDLVDEITTKVIDEIFE